MDKKTMEIEIVGFKCYSKASFTFPKDGVVLLKGCSGAGKSTILQAITWCLFGGLRGVDRNIGSKKGKLQVTIRMEIGGKKCEIIRQKRPNLLRFRAGRLEQIDEVAQAKINEHFGSEELWKMCCYLEQGQTNPLFRVSGSEKMSLLNKIAFNESDPTPYIRKIEEKLKSEKIRFQVLQETFQTECDDFSTFIKSQAIDPKDGRSEEDLKALYKEKEQLVCDIKTLRDKSIQHHESLASVSLLNEHIAIIEEKLKVCEGEDMSDERLTGLKRTIDGLLALKHFQLQLDQLHECLNTLRAKCSEYVDVEECDTQTLYEARSKRDLYAENFKKAQECDVEYDKSKIENKKEFLRCLFKIQPALKLHHSVMEVYKQIAALPTHNIDEKAVRAQEERIEEIKRGSDVMPCPKCGQNLLYKSKALEACDCAPASEEELKEAQKVLEDLNTQLQTTIHRRALTNQFEKLKAMYTEEISTVTPEELGILGSSSKTLLSPSEIEQYKTQQYLLHSIEVLEQNDVDISTLERGVKKKEVLELCRNKEMEEEKVLGSYTTLKDQCNECSLEDLPGLQNEVSRLQSLISAQKELTQNLERAQRQKTDYLSKLDYTIDTELPTKETRLNELSEILEKARVTNEAVRRQSSLQTQRNHIVESSKEVLHLERLKHIALDVECKVLQSCVDSINSTVNVLAENIFDDPIQVELKLYKQLKTKKTIKPGVNIEVRYKGGVYENPNDVSGGEQDRLSLLLTLAMNRLCGSPIVMLDETFSSLDESIKEHCLRAARSATEGKLVICVDHSGVEGYYDKVLQIGLE